MLQVTNLTGSAGVTTPAVQHPITAVQETATALPATPTKAESASTEAAVQRLLIIRYVLEVHFEPVAITQDSVVTRLIIVALEIATVVLVNRGCPML